jgi:hypothetical protein
MYTYGYHDGHFCRILRVLDYPNQVRYIIRNLYVFKDRYIWSDMEGNVPASSVTLTEPTEEEWMRIVEANLRE